jgi:hypothetical protein
VSQRACSNIEDLEVYLTNAALGHSPAFSVPDRCVAVSFDFYSPGKQTRQRLNGNTYNSLFRCSESHCHSLRAGKIQYRCAHIDAQYSGVGVMVYIALSNGPYGPLELINIIRVV